MDNSIWQLKSRRQAAADSAANPPSGRRARSRGQALLEFALSLPVLLLIMFLIIEAAFLIQGYLAVEHAAREAVRWAIAYQPVQGHQLDEAPCSDTSAGDEIADFLFANAGMVCDPNESETEYNNRRVALIKETAYRRAAGLRINQSALGLNEADFWTHRNEPGFFGVRVWGFPAFDTSEQLDHPGLQGLPVRVQVVHNVEIVDPLFRLVATHVQVEAHAEMINEGIQVGFGNQPPPTFQPEAVFTVISGGGGSGPGGGSTNTPRPTATPLPASYYRLQIAFEHVTNTLPLERGHGVQALVTDQDDTPLPNVKVSFSTNFGAFAYSGAGVPYAEAQTNSSGVAVAPIYANRPGTAALEAWIDLDQDGARDVGEPYDTALKTWVASGPYVLASDYEVLPLDWIAVDIYDHDPVGNPHTLLWCPTEVGGTPAVVLLSTIFVGSSGPEWGDALDLEVQIPEDSDGYYRLETHSGADIDESDCGSPTTRIAHSSDLLVVPALPDLTIGSFNLPALVPVQTVFTMSVVIENLTPGSTASAFDVDFYIDPGDTPAPGRMGVVKQWVSGISAYGTAVVTTVMWLESPGVHQIWARVDTTDYIQEENEYNNVAMIAVNAQCSYSTEWQSPSSNYAGSGGGFTNPGEAYANGGSYAYRNRPADMVSHNYGHYGFDIPDNATIEGIQVRLDWWLNSTSGTNYINVSLSGDGGSSWVGPIAATTRRTSDGNPTDVVGGIGNNWGWGWGPSGFADGQFVVNLQLRTSSTSRDFRIDWVPARVHYNICGAPQPSPWGDDTSRPPGMVECSQLFQATGFEGSVTTVFDHWKAGEVGAFQRSGYLQRQGAFSMRLHASKSVYPCEDPQNTYTPWLYQTVQIPSEIFTLTTFTVEGWRAVAGTAGVPCSVNYSPDADDLLFVQVLDGGGNPISEPVTVTHGGVPIENWQRFSFDFTTEMDLVNRAGQNVRVRFFGTHDQDVNGTWFFLDDMECNVCTRWPIPDPVPGMATVGGLTQALVGGVPQSLVGVDVWAYSQGGQVYRTRSIHNGTYHFYNIPPGTYRIYAEAWIGGYLRVASSTVTLVADDLRENIHLLLQ